jgi:hypothetical protein
MTPFAVDNSMLQAVNACELKAGLRYVLGLTTADDRLELDAGSACHEALAVWHRGEGKAKALATLKTSYQKPGSRVSVEDRLSYHNVNRVMTRFFGHFEQNALPYTPQKDLVEVVFEAPLDDNGDYLVIGRIDQVETYQGRLVIGENKTTGSLSGFWREKWPMHSQPTTYVYGAKYGSVNGKPLGLPVEECLILGIELRKVPDSDTKCRDHKIPYRECGDFHVKWEFHGPYPRPDGFIERWRGDAIAGARKLSWMKENVHTIQDCADLLGQQGQFNGSCQWCEFRDYCRQGVPVAMMEANLVHKPWDPRDVKHSGLIMPAPVPTPTSSLVSLTSTRSHVETLGDDPPPRGVLQGQAPTPSNARKGNGHESR